MQVVRTDLIITASIGTGRLKFTKQGKTAQISFDSFMLATDLASGSTRQIFTMAPEFSPATTYHGVLIFAGSKTALVTINTSGQITIQNYSGSAIAANTGLYGNLTYCVKIIINQP